MCNVDFAAARLSVPKGMNYISHIIEQQLLKKMIDHPRAPSRELRDQLTHVALKGGLGGWMPVIATDPKDQFHYAWTQAQHQQIDRVKFRLLECSDIQITRRIFWNPWNTG